MNDPLLGSLVESNVAVVDVRFFQATQRSYLCMILFVNGKIAQSIYGNRL